jgi:hypothetical protein
MTEQQHPMVPPNILLNNWESDWFNERQNVDVLLTQAYQAGADAELKACCKWLQCEAGDSATEFVAGDLRAARRPKPTSLKEQAWKLLECYGTSGVQLTADQCNTIREALEALPDD